MRRLWCVLALLFTLGAPALAESDTGAGGLSPICQTMLERNAPAQGGSRINLETFVPDPGCWLQASIKDINDVNLFTVTAAIAKFIVVASVLWALLTSIGRGTATPFLRALALGFVAFTAANAYTTKSGVGWVAADWAMGAWQTAYVGSARVGQAMLDQRILAKTKELDEKISNYVAISMDIQAIATQKALFGTKADPNTLETAYQEMQKTVDSGSNIKSPLPKSAYSAAYFLTLGIFSVFAILVYSSGMMVVISVLALPIVLALTTLGSRQFLQTVGVIWLSNVVTILIIPVFMAILMTTMLTSPVQSLNANLQYNIEIGTQMLTEVKQRLDSCSGVLFVACRAVEGIGAVIDGFTQGLESAFMGVGVAIFAIIVAFSVAVSQLRRIPATVERILGGLGGGESSGVFTDFNKRPRERRQRAAADASTQKTPALAPPASSGPKVTVTQLPKGNGLPGGGVTVPNPKVILAQATTRSVRGALPPPKP